MVCVSTLAICALAARVSNVCTCASDCKIFDSGTPRSEIISKKWDFPSLHQEVDNVAGGSRLRDSDRRMEMEREVNSYEEDGAAQISE
ncbi:hypothetical protein VKT23_010654 [Stygiomarasmius scandens]|uniref:Secreted protein n=1 Tax=Marasmiellus scandens TaxID=2682957 RepID=A0ABR1JBV1_9AGAR